MRKAPEFLAFFLIFITVQRVAQYIAEALHVGTMGWAFSFAIAGSIFVAMFYTGFDERTRKVAYRAAWTFILVDLIFNEAELIRTLSAKELITPESNFLGLGQAELRIGIQLTALLFGAIPTIGIAYLGQLQRAADQVWQSRPTPWQRTWKAIASVFGNITIGFAIRAEGVAANLLPTAKGKSSKLPTVDGQILGKKKADLSSADIAFIVANGREAIMARFGVSDGTAGNWKAEFKGAKNAPRLP